MQQTLIDIPHEIAGLPLFGSGWALIFWAIFGGVWLTRFYMQSMTESNKAWGTRYSHSGSRAHYCNRDPIH